MSGRHEGPPPADQEFPIEAVLEQDISVVENTVETYLETPTDRTRTALLHALEQLDRQIALGDAHDAGYASIYTQFGSTGGFPVLGATSDNPIAEDIPGPELQAQVLVVRAAKDEIKSPTAETLAALRSASDALTAIRSRQEAGSPPPSGASPD